MGHRANLVLVHRGQVDIHTLHWGGDTIDRWLLDGPERVVAETRDLLCHPSEGKLLDEVLAEGAALIDLDRRELLWFGGVTVDTNVPRRRALMELLVESWPGWSIRWASRGILSIARALGMPDRSVVCIAHVPETFEPVACGGDSEGVGYLVTAQTEAGPRAWRIDFPPWPRVILPTKLDRRVPELPLPTTLHAEGFVGGCHVDTLRRQAWVWSAMAQTWACPEGIARPDLDLDTRWLGDRFEDHAGLVPGLALVEQPRAEHLAAVLRSAAGKQPGGHELR